MKGEFEGKASIVNESTGAVVAQQVCARWCYQVFWSPQVSGPVNAENCYRAHVEASSTLTAQGAGSSQQCAGGGDIDDDPPFNDDCTVGPCSPLVLDLNGDGVQTTSAASDPVWFDINADGRLDPIGWTNPTTEEGFLWVDLNHDRIVNDGRELFGVATRLPDGSTASHGFAALQSYDLPASGGNGDGRITTADAVWGRLRLWVDANHDGRSAAGEIGPIQAYGVTALELAYVVDATPDPAGNEHRYRGTYRRRVVKYGPAEVRTFDLDDVFFARQQ